MGIVFIIEESQSLLNWGLLPTEIFCQCLKHVLSRNPFLTEVFFLLIILVIFTFSYSSQSLLNWGLLPTSLAYSSPLTGESQSLLNWGLLPTRRINPSELYYGRNPFLTEVFFLQKWIAVSQALFLGRNPFLTEVFFLLLSRTMCPIICWGRNPFLTEVFFLLKGTILVRGKEESQSLLNWGLLPTSSLSFSSCHVSSQSLLNWGLLPTRTTSTIVCSRLYVAIPS